MVCLMFYSLLVVFCHRWNKWSRIQTVKLIVGLRKYLVGLFRLVSLIKDFILEVIFRGIV